jgi:hypothetical protein
MRLAADAGGVQLIVWCKECQHQVEPDPVEMARGTAPKRPFSIGASGWFVLAVAAGRSIWW